ncbi:polysaccharide pyruvyl transferase CsaB [Tumidithrix elongata RA019]|uniref:Polysaccharide pyruvyl transferase CsaB n=1 Tax=Tumidithrix elongata BACA0141 TaxID=2716417 RepID=A0AAW9PRS5_9CYAN|nr:polysaccharide pyruvyl transferase CsaB [Tumidithrix elongata RA019]
MQQAVLCGYYGMGNAGDEALLAALLQMLPPTIQPLVLSANPKATEKLHQVEACDRYSVFALIKALKRSDIFIWGGGSLMQDVTSARNPIYYGGLMGLAYGMGLKTVAWAQGIGPLNRGLSRAIAKQAFQRCSLVSVRDGGSAQLLADWSVPSVMAPDPVWALTSEHPHHLSSVPAPRIAVMLRSHPLLTAQRLANVIEALIYLQKTTDTYLLLIPFQPSKDLAIAEQIHGAIPEQSMVLIDENPRSLKGIFHGVEMAIAMRYHGLIMAAAEGCRCSAISYDPKVSRLMNDQDIPGWELADLPDDPHAIAMTWIEQFANGDPLSHTQISSLKDRALIHHQLLTNL